MSVARALCLSLALTVVSGAVVLLDPADAAGADLTATLVASRPTSGWAQPSPDPSGIVWTGQHLIISDPEVDEMPALYSGTSLFRAGLTGEQLSPPGGAMQGWSQEPAGLGYLPGTDPTLLVADDDQGRIFRIWPHGDGIHGTVDDTVSSFPVLPPTTIVGDIAVDLEVTGDGHLLLVDALFRAVYDYDAGPDDLFGTTDDAVGWFDVGAHGAVEPRGIAYHPTRGSVLVLDQESRSVYELTRQGALLNTISIAAVDPVNPAGVTVAPASDGSGAWHLYVVDRGVDNNDDPTENDGRFYELSVPW
jgi:hypothetical protein